ncbi:MAG: response regulator transcription factor [Actinomycetaceae bacterium]|nr:response regulator transcription factor [Actinomycetaceae bacterium]
MITLGLVDDEPLFAAGVSMILDSQSDMEVRWQAIHGQDALTQQRNNPVDIILMDIQMPVLSGLEATRALISEGLPGRVLILTTFDTDENVLAAIEAGASGFLIKTTPPQTLIDSVRIVASGESVVSPGATRTLLSALRAGPHSAAVAPPAAPQLHGSDAQAVAQLTDREKEILGWIARGLTNQEICDELWLSMPTVKTHVGRLLHKTGSRDRVQLVLFALRTGLCDPSEILSPGR